MKRQIPLMLVFVSGAVMAIQFFVPSEFSGNLKDFMMDWLIIIGIFAMPLGIWSLVHISFAKIKRRSRDWQYSVITMLGLFAMIVFGLKFVGGGQDSYMFRQFFNHILIPIQATMFSLLAFFIASAAYRAFRARSILASVLLGAALILMLRLIPMGTAITGFLNDLSSWILLVPNLAAKRAILIGVGLGMVATALKVILGIERSYMGRD